MAARPLRVLVMGQTGAGKTQHCGTIIKHLGHVGPTPFVASAGVDSHTHDPLTVTIVSRGVQYEITDTPGLMDTEGRERDIVNITAIVRAAKAFPAVHAVLLIMNEQNPRFDAAMQACVKLLVDSLGPGVLSRFGILWSRAYGDVSVADSRARVAGMAAIVARQTGVPIDTFPSWQVDAHIDTRRGVTREFIAEHTAEVAAELDACVAWMQVQTPLETLDFKVGEYAEMRRIREEVERRNVAEEGERREAAARVVADETARREAESRVAAEAMARTAEAARVAAEARAAAEAAARRDAERRADEAEADANDTFFSFTRGFKINGSRVW